MNEKNFEFVVVNSGTLHKRRPDPNAFAEHFKDRCLTSVSPIFIFLSLQNFIQTRLNLQVVLENQVNLFSILGISQFRW